MHVTEHFQVDDDGWFDVRCRCGWAVLGLPDVETAVDVFGEHCYNAGAAEQAAEMGAG